MDVDGTDGDMDEMPELEVKKPAKKKQKKSAADLLGEQIQLLREQGYEIVRCAYCAVYIWT